MKQLANYWLFGISLILLGASLILNISHTVICNESLVITFVGILATFIVVGNYAQTTNLETKTSKKIEEFDNQLVEIVKTTDKRN
ncbi:MAG: hypothetical protein GX638_02545 [Crenarchaeota archaeon]|nr:hypothetical protein [Thermoproteota archaeon]